MNYFKVLVSKWILEYLEYIWHSNIETEISCDTCKTQFCEPFKIPIK